MVITLKSASFGWGLVVSLCVLGSNGCSGSSAQPAGGDASTPDAMVEAGPPPLGVPVSSCAGCPVCGGVLSSPTTGISYCTQDCKMSADCPTGFGCVANENSTMLLDM